MIRSLVLSFFAVTLGGALWTVGQGLSATPTADPVGLSGATTSQTGTDYCPPCPECPLGCDACPACCTSAAKSTGVKAASASANSCCQSEGAETVQPQQP
jgi:hypothetical protein